MKLFFTTFIIFFSIQTSFCQQRSKSYFELINNAEMCFFEEKYSNALSFYNKAFEKFNSPRGNDYYNAALIAFFINKEDVAYDYLIQAVKRGYSMDFLRNPILLQQLSNKSKWNVFESHYDSLYNLYVDKLKNPVIKELNYLVQEDQRLSNKIYFNQISQLQLDSLYLKNMQRIISFSENDSLPPVESFNMKSRKTQSIIPFILLRHYFGMVNRSLYYPDEYKEEFYHWVLANNMHIEEELLKMVRKGQISPVLISESMCYNIPDNPFGELGENFCRYVKEGDEYIMIEYFMVKQDYTNKEIEEINKNRKKWFLPEFDEAFKLTKDTKQLSDSIHRHLSKYFKYTGQLHGNEYFLNKMDSLEFIEYSHKFINNGYELEWIYLGIEDGWKLPEEYLKHK